MASASTAPATTGGDGSTPDTLSNALAAQDYVTIEERYFTGALICLEGHYTDNPPMGPKTHATVIRMISTALEKTHASKDVR